MLLKMYSVYDSKSAAYLQPFYASTDGVAIRSFSDAVNEPGHQFAKYPADFTLFCVGVFDDSNASIVTELTPRSMGLAQEFLNSKE